MTIIDTRVIKNTVKFQAIHRELCNIVHHTVLAASVQVYELSILSLRAKIRSRVVTMNNQTRISSWIRKRKTAPITLSLWWRRNGWSHAALWWINRGFQSMWIIKRKYCSMILSYETLFVYHSINEINIAQFGKMTSKTLIFSSPIYTCIFYIFKNLYLLSMNISS